MMSRLAEKYRNPLDTAVLLRCLFLVSAYILAILSPLVVYQKTQDLSIAGLLFLVEISPKYLVYLYAHDVIKKFGVSAINISLELVRSVLLIVFLLAVAGYCPWWLIVPASAITQAIYAVQNTAYEIFMKQWSDNDSVGHSRMLRADYFSASTAMILCFFIDSQSAIAMLLVAISCITFSLLVIKKDLLYKMAIDTNHKIKLSSPITIIRQINMPLWGMILLGLSLAIPLAATFNAAPYFLEYALGYKMTLDEVSVFSFVRMFVGFLATMAVMKILIYVNSSVIAKWSIGMLFVFLALMTVTSGYLFLLLIVAVCIAGILALPWQKSHRQTMMAKNHTTHITGMIIAIQSSSSLIAGMLYSTVADVYSIVLIMAVICPVIVIAGILMMFDADTIKGFFIKNNQSGQGTDLAR